MIDKLTLLTALSLAVSPSADDDPLASLPTERIDLVLKDAQVADVMDLVGVIGHRSVVLDPCVQGTLTLELKAVTLRSFLEVVADTLALSYAQGSDGALEVGCIEPQAQGKSERVDLSVVAAPLDEVLDVLEHASDTALSTAACDDVLVDLDARNAPVPAIVHSIAAQARATVEVSDGGLVIRCRA